MLALKLTLVPTFLLIVSMSGKWWGPSIAGWLAGRACMAVGIRSGARHLADGGFCAFVLARLAFVGARRRAGGHAVRSILSATHCRCSGRRPAYVHRSHLPHVGRDGAHATGDVGVGTGRPHMERPARGVSVAGYRAVGVVATRTWSGFCRFVAARDGLGTLRFRCVLPVSRVGAAASGAAAYVCRSCSACDVRAMGHPAFDTRKPGGRQSTGRRCGRVGRRRYGDALDNAVCICAAPAAAQRSLSVLIPDSSASTARQSGP